MNQRLQEKEYEITLLTQPAQKRIAVQGDNSDYDREIAVYVQRLKEKEQEIEKLKFSLQKKESPVKGSPVKAPENTQNNALAEEN